MKSIHKECLNCKTATFEPDCGYTCSEDRWDYLDKAHICPYYIVDEDYLLKQAKTFFEKLKVKRFINKNKRSN